MNVSISPRQFLLYLSVPCKAAFTLWECVCLQLQWKLPSLIQLKGEHHNFKTRIFKKSVRFLKKKNSVLLWCFKCFPFPPAVVGHVRRRFVSPEISFERKYCRCLRNLPCKGNLVSILTSDFNSWGRGSDWKISSWWILQFVDINKCTGIYLL